MHVCRLIILTTPHVLLSKNISIDLIDRIDSDGKLLKVSRLKSGHLVVLYGQIDKYNFITGFLSVFDLNVNNKIVSSGTTMLLTCILPVLLLLSGNIC